MLDIFIFCTTLLPNLQLICMIWVISMYLQAQWKTVQQIQTWIYTGFKNSIYSKTCVKQPFSKRPKTGFQD